MSEMEYLLELLHGARDSFSTARVTVRSWVDRRRRHEGMRRWAETRPRGSVAFFGPERPRTEEEEMVSRLWVHRPSRWRVEIEDPDHTRVRVIDGDRWWSHTSGDPVHTNVRSDQTVVSPAGFTIGGEPGVAAHFYDPEEVVSAVDLEPVGRMEHAGRDAILVTGVAKDGVEPVMWHGADRFEFLVDAEKGVLLKAQGWIDGELMASVEVTDVAFDIPIPADVFTFTPPPGTPVEVIGPTARRGRLAGRAAALESMPSPPATPPEVYLMAREAPERAQRGVLAGYDWWSNGTLTRGRPERPRQWPPPLTVSKGGTLVLRFDTPSAPVTVEARWWPGVGMSGAPEGEPSAAVDYADTRVFSSHPRDAGLAKRELDGREGWEMTVDLPGDGGTSFISVWATWKDLHVPSAGPYSANWGFLIET